VSAQRPTLTRTDFLTALHDGCEGVLELRALPSGARTFIRLGDEQGVTRFADAHAMEDVYFAVATRKDASSGTLQNCRHLSALFADVDFKLLPEPEARSRLARFPLPPSTVVRSGNGLHPEWLLREPMTLPKEAATARSLLRRLAHALGADLTAAEPARVLRLPGTLNQKYTPARQVGIETLDPDRRYNPSDFDEILPPEPTSNGHGAAFTMPDEPLAEGEGRNNVLYRLIRALHAKNVNAKSIVTTVEAENARFRPPLPDDELHALLEHGLTQPDRPDFTAQRNGHQPGARAVTVNADIRNSDHVAALPTIDVTAMDLPAVTAAAWAALQTMNTPPMIFRHGDVPGRIEQDDDGALLVRELTAARLRHHLARSATWIIKKGESVKPVAPPEVVCEDLLATPDPPLPRLRRIVEMPVLGRDGAVIAGPGYDAASGVYVAQAPDLGVFAVPATPTAEHLAVASAVIGELLVDFPFAGPADRAGAVALLLTPFARDLIDGPTPLFLIDKPAPGTGATLLVDVLLGPALGRSVGVMSEGRDEDEWRKRLTSALLQGRGAILIDNVRRPLDSGALSAMLTARVWEDRILGFNRLVRLAVRAVVVATGNNPAVSTEIARRTCRIRLDAKVDRPWQRQGFRHPDLLAWVAEQRGEFAWAALTIARGWVVAGRRAGTARMGMFESWATTLSGMLELAGIPGLMSSIDEFYESADADGQALRGFIAAWWKHHGDGLVTVGELLPIATTSDIDISGKNERAQQSRLGRLLTTHRDRTFVIDGMNLIVTKAKELLNGSARWRMRRRDQP
jgi:RepB DNA-primase from phage plasmid